MTKFFTDEQYEFTRKLALNAAGILPMTPAFLEFSQDTVSLADAPEDVLLMVTSNFLYPFGAEHADKDFGALLKGTVFVKLSSASADRKSAETGVKSTIELGLLHAEICYIIEPKNADDLNVEEFCGVTGSYSRLLAEGDVVPVTGIISNQRQPFSSLMLTENVKNFLGVFSK